MNKFIIIHNIYHSQYVFISISYYLNFLKILEDKLHKINKIMRDVYQLSSTNKINTKYKIQSHISYKFIIIMDFYNKNYFVQHVLQVTRYV